jgi:hypothetical protein
MNALQFLNHVDQRVNPYRITETEARARIEARGLTYRWQCMAKDQAWFLRQLADIEGS